MLSFLQGQNKQVTKEQAENKKGQNLGFSGEAEGFRKLQQINFSKKFDLFEKNKTAARELTSINIYLLLMFCQQTHELNARA